MLRELKLIFSLLFPFWPFVRIRPDYTSDVGGAVAVIAAPFNRYLVGHKPDVSNGMIADMARVHMEQLGLPFIGQWEQTNILRDQFPSDQVIEFVTGQGEWVQTPDIMKWVADQVFKMNRGNVVILVGHPDHVRCVAISARYYGLDPRISPLCKEVWYDSSDRPGAQWWCKSREAYFLFWEPFVARPGMIAKAILGKLR